MGNLLSGCGELPEVAKPAAEIDMDAAEYDMRCLEAPALRGWPLRIFVAVFVQSPLWAVISPRLFWNSGIPQQLRRKRLPEVPCPEPNLSSGPPADKCPSTVIPCTADNFAERADLAATSCCPSFRYKGQLSPQDQLEFRPKIRDFNLSYSSGRTTPSAVIEKTLERIRASEALDPPMRFFISIDEEDVRRQAAAATKRWQEGRPLSVLDGVPMAVKDDTDQLPYKTTVGTSFMADLHQVIRDAQHVGALRSAGVILLGKANMHEIGQGVTGWNAHYQPARNPHSPSHFTGGSSSGSAALVAAGICPVAIGADGGGSIRIPSAFCGVVGLIPTYGRTKEEHKGPKATNTVGTTGPIAGCTEDLALVYAVTSNLVDQKWINSQPCRPRFAAPPPLTVPRLPSTNTGSSLAGIKVGIFRKWFEDAEPDIVKCCYSAVHLLQEMGAELVDIVIPELEAARVAHTCLISSEMYSFYGKLAALQPSLWGKFGYDIQVATKSGGLFTASDVYTSQQIRTRMTIYYQKAFDKVDIIVTPTTAISAPHVGLDLSTVGESNLPQLSKIMRFIVTANLVGFPAMSVPVGYDSDEMPVGLQLMGRPWSEASLLDCAHKLETRLPPHRRPDIALGVLSSGSACS